MIDGLVLWGYKSDDATGIGLHDTVQALLIVDAERSRFTPEEYLVIFLPGCHRLSLYLGLGLAKHDIRKVLIGSTIE